jgi:hypothetical protein
MQLKHEVVEVQVVAVARSHALEGVRPNRNERKSVTRGGVVGAVDAHVDAHANVATLGWSESAAEGAHDDVEERGERCKITIYEQ